MRRSETQSVGRVPTRRSASKHRLHRGAQVTSFTITRRHSSSSCCDSCVASHRSPDGRSKCQVRDRPFAAWFASGHAGNFDCVPDVSTASVLPSLPWWLAEVLSRRLRRLPETLKVDKSERFGFCLLNGTQMGRSIGPFVSPGTILRPCYTRINVNNNCSAESAREMVNTKDGRRQSPK